MMHCNVFYHIHALFLLYLRLIPFLHNFVSFLKETIEFNCATENSWLHGLSLKYNQLTVNFPLKKTEFLPYNSEPRASCSARRETLCPPFLYVKECGPSPQVLCLLLTTALSLPANHPAVSGKHCPLESPTVPALVIFPSSSSATIPESWN